MYTFIHKKIVKIFGEASIFIRENLAQIVIIVGAFVLLEVIQSFPYINIIPNYQFLVIGFTLLLAVVLLRVSISNKKIMLAVLVLLFLGAIITIFDIEKILELVGFVAFVLLVFIIIRQIVNDRESLKKTDSE
ncbi:MAG: hypothetical protein AAB583_06315 [Patescibacteria group bacterium]